MFPTTDKLYIGGIQASLEEPAKPIVERSYYKVLAIGSKNEETVFLIALPNGEFRHVRSHECVRRIP